MNPLRTVPRTAARTFGRQRGFTLIEAAITTSIVAIAAGAAMHGMAPLKSRQQVAAAASEFETDVQHARSLAVLRNLPVRLAFVTTPAGACYVIHSGPAGSCSCRSDGQAVCRGEAEPLRSVGFGGAGSLTVGGNLRSLAFDPVAGTVTPAGTLRFTAQDGTALHQVVNVMGRVRTCSPRGAVAGFKPC